MIRSDLIWSGRCSRVNKPPLDTLPHAPNPNPNPNPSEFINTSDVISAVLTQVVAESCAVLCCAVLCCAVLCCAVLCCAVLCCAVLRFKISSNSHTHNCPPLLPPSPHTRTHTRTQPQELYLRNPAAFNISPGQSVTFAELSETVRMTHQTAVGIIRGGRLAMLAPHAAHQMVIGADDRVVVIAEEF